MLKRFEQFVSEHHLCTRKQAVILAVSGGIDSMVMLDLFRRGGYSFVVAHMNFQLRGVESNDDEAFVREHCDRLQIPFHCKRVETNNYASERKLSVQVAARNL